MFGGGVVLGGFRYVSADERWILQARRDSFVLSFVGTKEERYPGWKDFEPEARRLWEAYREAWQPERITRIALRFVNQFSFVDNSDLTSDYLAMLPRFPRQDFLRDGAFSDYAFRILLPQGDIKADAVISHALITAPEARTVLDIDLFAEQEINAKEDTVLWERFTTLRHRKNELFQACITGAVEQSLEPRQA